MKLLTNLIFEPKGKHDPALAYNIKDTVMSADGSKVYFALQDVPENTPLTDEDFWKLQIDLSGSKSAMDEALASFSDYAKIVGTRVKGEVAKVSGNPVTFLPDAGSLLQPVTVLEPKQAGSGDPYPAGGGKNLINVGLASPGIVKGVTFTPNENGSITLTGAKEEGYAGITGLNMTAVNLRGKTLTLTVPNPSYICVGLKVINTAGETVWLDAPANEGGYTFTMPDNAETMAYNCYISTSAQINYTFYPQLELGSTATEYAPYSNIRPITGYDAVGLNHAGKNFMPILSASDFNSYGVEWKNNKDGSWTANGTATYAAYITGGAMAFVLGVLPAGEYKLNVVASSEETGKLYLRIGSGAGAAFLTSNDSQSKDKECTFVADGVTEYYAAIAIKSGETVKDYRIFPVLADSSHSVWSINFGQTVYGGKMNWLTGKLVAEWAMVELDGTETFVGYAGGDARLPMFTPKLAPATHGGICSNVLKSAYSYGEIVGTANTIAATQNSIVLHFDGIQGTDNAIFTDVAAKVAGLKAAGTPVQIAYKLATSIEIQLTPHIISAVEPEQTNTLYGDGSIDVEYVKPLHVSIEERVAAAVAAAMNTEGE